MLGLSRYAVVTSMVGMSLVACSVSPQVRAIPGLASSAAKVVVREHWRARMDGGAAKWDLLYVSNDIGTSRQQRGTVGVYRYWQQTLVQTLYGFKVPRGACVDAANNVYITDFGADDVVEYAHGGETPIRTLAAYAPLSCAVDQRSGDLAVANWFKGVSIYRHGTGEPRTYTDSFLAGYYALGYDSNDNLLVTDGCGYYNSDPTCLPADFAYLPSKAKSLVAIGLPGYYLNVSAILWDGRYWVIPAWAETCKISYACLTRIGISGGKATYVSTTNLNDFDDPGAVAVYNDDNPKQQATQIAGPPGFYSNIVYFWNYPRGRKPVGRITDGVQAARDAAISYRTVR
ncbi:MAG TPA: hypothetical protein VMT95_00665 [Candidatus Binatia bacterium]|nr:hypothetical protein [Candidatus Binatia bacterium]